MFPDASGHQTGRVRLPHVRGGVSSTQSALRTSASSSPRPWGCFHHQPCDRRYRQVFPTSVGVFPPAATAHPSTRCLPHVRGGVSNTVPLKRRLLASSPRPWGCFPATTPAVNSSGVFPTSVGVFLTPTSSRTSAPCLPHVRGGVSGRTVPCQVIGRSSPRPWGCFFLAGRGCHLEMVFPTSVGVFPNSLSFKFTLPRLPHVRGGVSGDAVNAAGALRSSPRPWGCFLSAHADASAAAVFPTSVGVFPWP